MVMLTLGLCLVGCGKKEENPQSNDDDMADGDGDAMPTTVDDSSPKEPTQPKKPLPEDIPSLKALAEEGDARAQNSLGWNYVYGQGVETDNREGIRWYLKAAEQGYAKAQFNLGQMYRFGRGIEKDDIVTAYTWFNFAATNGDKNAKKILGIIAGYEMTAAQITTAKALAKEMVKKNPKLINKKE